MKPGAAPAAQAVIARPYRDLRDSARIRSLLIETHPLVRPGWTWDMRRWDGWRFDRDAPWTDADLACLVGLWETADLRVVGVVHPEAPGEAWIELHPDWRHLEHEMLNWAEVHLSLVSPVRDRTLAFFVSLDTGDGEAANALYADCGFTDAYHGHVWRRVW